MSGHSSGYGWATHFTSSTTESFFQSVKIQVKCSSDTLHLGLLNDSIVHANYTYLVDYFRCVPLFCCPDG